MFYTFKYILEFIIIVLFLQGHDACVWGQKSYIAAAK